MTALQEKCRALEAENERLRQNTIALEEKYFSDKENWQAKILSEIDRCGETEKRYESHIHEVNVEINKLRGRVQELQSENSMIRSKTFDRSIQDVVIPYTKEEKESWLAQISDLQNQLEGKTREINSLERAISKTESERDELFTEVSELQRKYTNLETQNRFLQSTVDDQAQQLDRRRQELDTLQTQVQTVELRASQNSSEKSDEQIRRLKDKVATLKQMNQNVNEQSNLLRDQLSHANEIAIIARNEAEVARATAAAKSVSPAPSSDRPSASSRRRARKARTPKKIRTTSPPAPVGRHSCSRTRLCSITSDNVQNSPEVHHILSTSNQKTPRSARSLQSSSSARTLNVTLPKSILIKRETPSKPFTEDQLNQRIIQLEEDLQSCNRSYKELLSESVKGDQDLTSLRIDLNRLAKEIQQKSKEIMELRQSQSKR